MTRWITSWRLLVCLTVVTTIVISAFILAAPAAAAKAVIELRAGCVVPKGGAEANALDKFIELVHQKTNGEIKIINFYTGLGVEQQLAEQVMTGAVDIGTISTGNATRWTNALTVLDLPFIFRSSAAALESFQGPVMKPLVEQFEKDLNLKLLFPMSPGSGRDIQTRKIQLKTPADIKGLKIRVLATPVDLETFKAWGANPTPVSWGQTYTALQQGVVDGENITLSGTYSSKHYEVVKYIVRLDYQMAIGTVYINPKKFASFSPEHQKAILDAAQEADLWSRKVTGERVKFYEDELQKLGMIIYKPTAEEYAQWSSIREKAWQEIGERMKGKIDLEVAQKLFDSQK